jgi:hypothetical protein
MEDGDRHTLALLELRELAREASDTTDVLAQRFQALLRSVSNPNAADLAKELPFKVRQFKGKSGELLRTLSLNGNIELARAAFETAKWIYPNDRLVLLWGSYVVDDTSHS